MTYKYKKIVTTGANGTTIAHSNIEENAINMLGQIGEYIYISALSLDGQNENLIFEEVALMDEEKTELLSQRHMQSAKLNARNKIRKIKDFEDDLTDQKILIQFLARGIVALFNSQPQEVKDANVYKGGFEALSETILTKDVRLDLEDNQVAKIINIILVEEVFANIVHDEYKGRL